MPALNGGQLVHDEVAEKARINAIFNASEADKDSFAEIVDLINSVDTESDAAFSDQSIKDNIKPIIDTDAQQVQAVLSEAVKERDGLLSVTYGNSAMTILLLDKTFAVYTTKTAIISIANILAGAIDEYSQGNDPLQLISVQSAHNGLVVKDANAVNFTSTARVGVAASFEYTVRNTSGDTADYLYTRHFRFAAK